MPSETRQNRQREIGISRVGRGLVWLLVLGGLLPENGFSQADDPTAESRSLADSATLIKDRAVQSRYDRAVKAVDEGRLIPAVELICELLEARTHAWILPPVKAADHLETGRPPQQEHWLEARVAAWQLLEQAGQQALRMYQEQTADQARIALAEAVRNGSSVQLRDVTLRFRGKREGLIALQHLASLHLDRGHRQTAAAAFRQILNHPQLTADDRQAARRGLAFAVSGQPDAGPELPHASRQSSEKRVETGRIRPELARLVPFRGEPLWEQSTGVSAESSNAISEALHEYSVQSIPVSLRARPVIADNSVVVRMPGHIQRLAPDTGQAEWEHPAVLSATLAGTGITTNASMQDLMSRNLAKELQIDSISSRVVTHRGSAIYVETTPRTPTTSGRPPGAVFRLRAIGPFGNRTLTSPGTNRIVHCDLATGATTWTFSSGDLMTDDTPDDGARPTSPPVFLGPPTPVDDRFLGLAQVGSVIQLYALNRDGDLAWQRSLCETGRPLNGNVDWRHLACPLTLAGGVLICPTSAGLVVAIDPVTGTPVWANRYARQDLTGPAGQKVLRPGGIRTRHWWRCWREVAVLPVIDGDHTERAVLVSPDRRGLIVLDLRTGREVWQRQIEQPLTLAGVTAQYAVITEHRAVTAFDLSSGNTAWRVEVPEISGSGYITSGQNGTADNAAVSGASTAPQPARFYVFPTHDHRLNAVRLHDGHLLRTHVADSSPAGNLVRVGNLVLEQTASRVSAWRILNDCLAPRPEEGRDPTMVAAALTRVGQFEEAIAFCDRLLAPDADPPLTGNARSRAEQLLWVTLTSWLTAQPEKSRHMEFRMREMIGDADIQREIQLAHGLARASAAAGKPAAALDRFFQVLNLNPGGSQAVYFDGPLRKVRRDRLIQGELINLIPGHGPQATTSDPGQTSVTELQAVLQKRFTGHLQRALSSPDPFAAQRLALNLSDHPWSTPLRLDEKSEVGLPFLRKQLALLQLTSAPELKTAARALERLARLYRDRSHTLDAAATTLKQRTLLEDHPDTRTLGLSPELDRLPARESLQAQLADSDWAGLRAEVELVNRPSPAGNYLPVAVQCEAGSLFERIDVAVSRRVEQNSRTVQFCGDGVSRAWKLAVPAGQSASSRGFSLPRGWGIGHLLILELGGELLAISPYSRNGQPQPQLVWSRDMTEGNRLARPLVLAAIPGFQPVKITYQDPFDRPVATTGPVRNGYLCVQTRGRLVCLQTASGQILWERYELPRNAICLGDERTIFLIDPERKRVEHLRVTDGARTAVRTLPAFDTVLMAGQSCLLLRNNLSNSAKPSDSPAVAVDLRTGQALWNLPEDTVNAFRADSQTVGALSSDGVVTLRELSTGRTLATVKLQVPQGMNNVFCVCDRQRWFIGIHSAEAGGPRRFGVTFSEPLNGRLAAIRRSDGQLLWERSVSRSHIPVPQPGSIPVLVLAWSEQPDQAAQQPKIVQTTFHLIDRRTGETIYNRRFPGNSSACLVDPDPAQKRVEIQTARRTLRLDFRKPVED